MHVYSKNNSESILTLYLTRNLFKMKILILIKIYMYIEYDELYV